MSLLITLAIAAVVFIALELANTAYYERARRKYRKPPSRSA
jgi:hypothetical protein